MADKIKFYFDENVPSAIANGIRLRGVDTLTAKEANMRGTSDIEQLTFAASQNRVIFSLDVDFLRLHAKGVNHTGIVYAHQQKTNVSNMIRGIMLIYNILTPADMLNHVEYL